ncbi:GNAT family N-acetyltransferase [Nocardia sp. NPDC127579]|uniref:GNAT family N-acetyltransferase n=1 Tax=Nocardia sp. NPDC127579 TaxID=3345402 RepID=UPI003628340C
MTHWGIRPLTPEYTRGLAECHIACWREAYRGLVPDQLLDAFEIEPATRRWARNLERHPGSIHVAVSDDVVVGFAGATENKAESAVAEIELQALYVRSPWYGSGLAAELLWTAVDPARSSSLWVFEGNPRARSFYRKHGFALDGGTKLEEFTPALQVRMVRPARVQE